MMGVVPGHHTNNNPNNNDSGSTNGSGSINGSGVGGGSGGGGGGGAIPGPNGIVPQLQGPSAHALRHKGSYGSGFGESRLMLVTMNLFEFHPSSTMMIVGGGWK